MLLKDSKGNMFELDDLLTGVSQKPAAAEREDCGSCPYQGMCEEENEISETQSQNKILFFEISTN